MAEYRNFDAGWRYHAEVPGESAIPTNKGVMYVAAKTERIKNGPGAYHHYDDPDSWSFEEEMPNEKWSAVCVPHDYIIGQTPNKEENAASGFFHYHNAWYRKHFSLDAADRGKRISLLFEGVSGNSTVYLNGCLIQYNHCGYTPFEADISDYVFFDRENVVAVYIDMSLVEGWWYRGAGIYRHVRLMVADKVCVSLYGNFIYPLAGENGRWRVPIETTLRNDTYADAQVILLHHILDAQGRERALYRAEGLAAAREETTLRTTGEFEAPQLWDTETPYLYTLRTEVVREGRVCDTQETRFGFRTAVFDAEKGFLLNGRPVKIKGLCAHQDFGLTGIAVPDNIYRYRVEMMKEMGANGYRTSHYPHDPATMDALDEMGFLVLAEIRHFDSNDDAMRQLEITVKRDRSRPSVIFWSTGNEEMRYHNYEQGVNIQRAMMARVKRLDPYRPVTTAVGKPQYSAVMPVVDVIGINYSLMEFEKFHRQFPEKPVVSTENCAVGSTFGTYFGDREAEGRLDARDRDRDVPTWYFGREGTWKFIMERDWVAGGYQWDAIEHRGEATWPRLCSASGAIDLFMRKKDAFFQNQSHWTQKPMIHMLPHWTHPGMEGEKIRVWAYTNCEEAELFLNGESMGRQTVKPYTHLEWDAVYAPGEIACVGYRGGEEAARDTHRTAGRPCALKLTQENGPLSRLGEDMAVIGCYAVDAAGNPVPNAELTVRFECDNGGVIVGTGSSTSDHHPVTDTERRMFAGRIAVGAVAKNAGTTRVFAFCEGLPVAKLKIDVTAHEEAPASAPAQEEPSGAGHTVY